MTGVPAVVFKRGCLFTTGLCVILKKKKKIRQEIPQGVLIRIVWDHSRLLMAQLIKKAVVRVTHDNNTFSPFLRAGKFLSPTNLPLPSTPAGAAPGRTQRQWSSIIPGRKHFGTDKCSFFFPVLHRRYYVLTSTVKYHLFISRPR